MLLLQKSLTRSGKPSPRKPADQHGWYPFSPAFGGFEKVGAAVDFGILISFGTLVADSAGKQPRRAVISGPARAVGESGPAVAASLRLELLGVITVVGNQKSVSQLRSRRIPFNRRVLVAPRGGGERRWEESFDLSLGGLFITTMLPLDVGEVVDIDMPLDSLRFQAPAEVVWNRGSQDSDDEPVGMALQFLNLNPHQKKLIHREISNHTRVGGQLKVGKPPPNGGRPAASASTGSRSTGSRRATGRKPSSGSPSWWWLVAGAAVVVTALIVVLLI